MKLKLALLHELMSKDKVLLCLLRGVASRSVRLTLWPPETDNKVALLMLSFSVWSFPSLEIAFTIYPRFLASNKVLFD